MRKISILALLLILFTGLFYGGDECPPPSPPGGESGGAGGEGGSGSPGGDHPDEGKIIAGAIFRLPEGKGIGIGNIYFKGFAKESAILVLRTSKDVKFIREGGNERFKLLVFPTGALYGEDGNLALKYSLEEYVRNGGTVLVFTQQHGRDYSVLPTPSDLPLYAYGWREDQSCLFASAYLSADHPALSSLRHKVALISLDGYFERLPNNAVSLLKRTKNSYPVLAYYKYGNGYVILTSMYEDWGYIHGGSTRQGRSLIRDLITWAKAPDMEIPVYTLPEQSEGGSVDVSLNLEVEDSTSLPASKVKLLWLTPDRSRVVYEEEKEVNLPPGGSTTLPVSHTFDASEIPDSDLGIWHLDYQLYDSDGNLIQPERETPTGRFAFRRSVEGNFNPSAVQIWATTDEEVYFYGSEVLFKIHIKNNKDESITGELRVRRHNPWGDNYEGSLGNYTVEPGQEKVIEWRDELVHSSTYDFWYGSWAHTIRGIWVRWPEVSLEYHGLREVYAKNSEVEFELHYMNTIEYSYPFKLTIEVYNSNGEKVKDLGSYDLTLEPSGEGFIRKKLDLAREGFNEGTYIIISKVFYSSNEGDLLIGKSERNFRVRSSNIGVMPYYNQPPLPGNIINLKIKNYSTFSIADAKVKIMLKKNEEVLEEYNREFVLGEREEKTITYTIGNYDLSPGSYRIEYVYLDTTGTVRKGLGRVWNMGAKIGCGILSPFLKRGGGRVHIGGVNNDFMLSPLKAIIKIPEINFTHEEEFQIPEGYREKWSKVIELKIPYSSPSGRVKVKIYVLTREGKVLKSEEIGEELPPYIASIYPALDKEKYKAGEEALLNLRINLNSHYSFVGILPVTLKITAFGVEQTKALEFNSEGEGVYEDRFSIKIPENVEPQGYPVEIKILFPDNTFSKTYAYITVPPPTYELIFLGSSVINVGEDIKVKLKNVGGVKGNFHYKLSLLSIVGEEIAKAEGDDTLDIGQERIYSLAIPQALAGGKYILRLLISDSVAGETTKEWELSVSGPEVDLLTRTDKEKYLEGETVNTITDIISSLDLSGRLNLEIYRLEAGGTQDLPFSDFLEKNEILMGAEEDGMYYLLRAHELLRYVPQGEEQILLKEDEQRLSTFFKDGNDIWVGSEDGEIWKIGGNAWVLPGEIYQFEKYNGQIYAATDAGLYKLDGSEWVIVKDEAIYSLEADDQNRLWAGGDGVVYMWDGSSWSQWEINGEVIFDISYDSEMVYFADGNALFVFDGSDWTTVSCSDWCSDLKNVEGNIYVYDGTKIKRLEGTELVQVGGEVPWDGTIFVGSSLKLATYRGIRKFENGKWVCEFLQHSPGLLSEVKSITFYNGKLWIGTSAGVNVYDGEKFEVILRTAEHEIEEISAMNSDGENLYIFTVRGVIVKSSTAETFIPYSKEWLEIKDAVGWGGKVWVLEENIGWAPEEVQVVYKYENGNWTEINLEGGSWVKLAPDKEGNIWACSPSQLFHEGTYLENRVGDCYSLAFENGKVWIGGIGKLGSFDGENWEIWDDAFGVPAGEEVVTIYKMGEKMSFVAPEGQIQDGAHLNIMADFAYNGTMWVKDSVSFYMDFPYNWPIMCATDGRNRAFIGSLSENNFRRGVVFEGEGPGTSLVWSHQIKEVLQAGVSKNEQVAAGAFQSGTYILKAKIFNQLNQLIKEASYGFEVYKEGISILVVPQKLYFKTGQQAPFKVKLRNATQIPENIELTVYADEEVLHQESLTIAAGEEREISLSVLRNEEGPVKLRAVAQGASSNFEDVKTIEFQTPALNIDVKTPEYAAEKSEVEIILTNLKKVPATVTISCESLGWSEEVTLAPEEVKKWIKEANTDTDYTIDITGDWNGQKSFRIEEGRGATANVETVSNYPEGKVTIPYEINGSGKLPTSGVAVFRLRRGAQIIREDRLPFTVEPGDKISGSISYSLGSGEYTLSVESEFFSTTASLNVLPASGVVNIQVSPEYREGVVSIPISIKNISQVEGSLSPVFIVEKDGQVISERSEDYFLASGEQITSELILSLTPGSYAVKVQGANIQPASASFEVLPGFALEADAEAIYPTGVRLNVENKGWDSFEGYVLVRTEFAEEERQVLVGKGESVSLDISLHTDKAQSGTYTAQVWLFEKGGREIFSKEVLVEVKGARVNVEVSGDEVQAGQPIEVHSRLINSGDRFLELKYYVEFSGEMAEERIFLAPGEEKEFTHSFRTEEDLPRGNYPVHWKVTGTVNKHGLYMAKINGLNVEVTHSLDKDAYKEGETAHLTLEVTTNTTEEVELKARASYENWEGEKIFRIQGQATVEFDIPLTQITGAKLFYGIYTSSGRSLHLNSLHIYKSEEGEAVSVSLDKQRYLPGETATATISSQGSGEITLMVFGETQTLNISPGTTTWNFLIPEGTPANSYALRWSFTPVQEGETLSGERVFDVDGISIKIADFTTDRKKYSASDTVKAEVLLESNTSLNATFEVWLMNPEGESVYISSNDITLNKGLNSASFSWPIETTKPGVHKIIYSISSGDQIYASGAQSIMVADLGLLSISTDKYEYPSGTEPVLVKVKVYGEGSGTLKLLLDGEEVQQRSVEVSGLGTFEFTLTEIEPGEHILKAHLEEGSLSVEKRVSFIYGSALPDLTLRVFSIVRVGPEYTAEVLIVNSGKQASSPTTVSVYEGRNNLAETAIEAIQPGENTWLNMSFSLRKFGDIKLTFKVDPSNTVREFNEENNVSTEYVHVEPLEIKVNSDKDSYGPAENMNVAVSISCMKEEETRGDLQIFLINESSGEIVWQRKEKVTVPSWETVNLPFIINTDSFPAGVYSIKAVFSSEQSVEAEKYIEILPVKVLSGEIEVKTKEFFAGPLTLEYIIHIKNEGNVALENEEVKLVLQNEDEERIKEKSYTVNLAIGEKEDIEDSLDLTLEAGKYALLLIFNEEEIARTEFEVKESEETTLSKIWRPKPLIEKLIFPNIQTQTGKMEEILASAGVYYKTVDWGRGLQEFRKNLNNFMLTETIMRSSEYRERIRDGEGMIYLIPTFYFLAGRELTPAEEKNIGSIYAFLKDIGIEMRVGGKKSKQYVLHYLPSGISQEDEEIYTGRYFVFETNEEVEPVAQINGENVIIVKPYGKGKILLIGVYTPVLSKIGPIIISSLNYLLGQKSEGHISRIEELKFSLSTHRGGKYIVEASGAPIVESLPQGTYEEDKVKWKLEFSEPGTKEIYFSVKLPDEVKENVIKVVLYRVEEENAEKLKEESLTLPVSYTVSDYTDLIINELSQCKISECKRAKRFIEMTSPSIPPLVNLMLTIRALNVLRSVKIELPVRTRIIELMRYYEIRTVEEGF